jgi:hypothetical protein
LIFSVDFLGFLMNLLALIAHLKEFRDCIQSFGMACAFTPYRFRLTQLALGLARTSSRAKTQYTSGAPWTLGHVAEFGDHMSPKLGVPLFHGSRAQSAKAHRRPGPF